MNAPARAYEIIQVPETTEPRREISCHSVLPPKLRYRFECDTVIGQDKHYCWTSAEGWEMEQLHVCHLCLVKNMALFYELRRKVKPSMRQVRRSASFREK